MEQIKSYTDTIATALSDLASAEKDLLVKFAGSAVVLLFCAAGAVVLVATGVGIVGGIVAVIAGVGVFIGAISTAIGDLKSAANKANTSVQTDVVNDWKGFPEQGWPTATIYG